MSMKRMLMAGASVLLFSGCSGTETSCLARGTRVKTPDGWKPIERLEVGDKVVCWDHETDDYVETEVTATKKVRREVVAIAVGNMRLRMTSDHPVWSPEAQDYRPAGDWVTGDLDQLLRTTRGTEVVDVTDRIAYDGITEVFDITVAHDLHNFVADGFVVHNKSIAVDPCPAVGEGVLNGDPCECPSGEESGYLRCSYSPATAVCVCSDGEFPYEPPAADAGVDDAGGDDAGADSDAGDSSDASTTDAA